MRNTYIHKIVSILVITGLTFFGFTNADYQLIENVSCKYNRCEGQQRIDININGYDKIKIDTNNCTDGEYGTLKVKYDGKQQFLTCGNLPKILENIKTFSIGSDSNNRDVTNTYQIYGYVPPMVQGGTEAFSGAINKLGTYAGEILPYMLYIGLGALGVSILFVALKRILNRLKRKTFKSIR